MTRCFEAELTLLSFPLFFSFLVLINLPSMPSFVSPFSATLRSRRYGTVATLGQDLHSCAPGSQHAGWLLPLLVLLVLVKDKLSYWERT